MKSKLRELKIVLKSIRFATSNSFRIAKFETFTILLFSFIYAILPYISSYLLGHLVNKLNEIIKIGVYFGFGIFWLFLGYAIISSLPNLINGMVLYFKKAWRFKFQAEMEVLVLRKRAEIDIAHYEDPKFQDLYQRAFQRSHWPVLELADIQFDIFRGIVALITGSILAANFNPLIYLVIILSSVPKFITEYKYGYNVWSIWMKDSPEQRRFVDLRKYFLGRISITETKLFQTDNYLLNWIKKILLNFNDQQLGAEKKRMWRFIGSELLAFGGFVLVSFFILQDVLQGSILVGSMVFLLSTLGNVQNSIGDLLATIARQNERHLIVKDIIEFIETKPFVKQKENSEKINLENPPIIKFENVSFKYINSNKWSLRNLNLTFEPGQKIGLVGNNGAGKTTLIKLLCRIYDPTEGKITVNGVDLKNIKTEEWWSYLGVMFQDFISYDFITKEAIAIGRPDKPIDIDLVKKAGQTSQSDPFIQEWKRKYDEPIGVEFEGVEPSKGQRQKLAIARTLYRNPFILILDEPTASVDAESEAKIFDSLDNLPNSMTAILISHDFSTIRECDKIFVFDHGELIEEGTHNELTQKDGLYNQLFKLQAERFK